MAMPFPRRFEFIRILGSGKNGVVFLAEDRALARSVAIKVYDRRGRARDARLEQAREESRKLARVMDHRIAQVFDFGVLGDQGSPFVVMELVEGRPLRAWLKSAQTPSFEERARAWHEISEALSAAHRGGAFHGDPHANNVMKTAAGVKLIDFGTSRFSSPERSRARESRILWELAREVFPDANRSLLDVPSWNLLRPELALEALAAWVQVTEDKQELTRLPEIRTEEFYDYECRARLHSIAAQLQECPLISADALVADLRAMNLVPFLDFFFCAAAAGCDAAREGRQDHYSIVNIQEPESHFNEAYRRWREAFLARQPGPRDDPGD